MKSNYFLLQQCHINYYHGSIQEECNPMESKTHAVFINQILSGWGTSLFPIVWKVTSFGMKSSLSKILNLKHFANFHLHIFIDEHLHNHILLFFIWCASMNNHAAHDSHLNLDAIKNVKPKILHIHKLNAFWKQSKLTFKTDYQS